MSVDLLAAEEKGTKTGSRVKGQRGKPVANPPRPPIFLSDLIINGVGGWV